jgi:hypothetical protein
MITPNIVKIGLLLYFLNMAIGLSGTALQIYLAPPDINRPFMFAAFFIGLIFLGFLGYKMLRGSNLFRLINAALVIGGNLSILSGLTTVTFYHPIGFYFYWVASAFSVGAVVLLFTPPANIWYQIDHNAKA